MKCGLNDGSVAACTQLEGGWVLVDRALTDQEEGGKKEDHMLSGVRCSTAKSICLHRGPQRQHSVDNQQRE